jgi:hypothetical protein
MKMALFGSSFAQAIQVSYPYRYQGLEKQAGRVFFAPF